MGLKDKIKSVFKRDKKPPAQKYVEGNAAFFKKAREEAVKEFDDAGKTADAGERFIALEAFIGKVRTRKEDAERLLKGQVDEIQKHRYTRLPGQIVSWSAAPAFFAVTIFALPLIPIGLAMQDMATEKAEKKHMLVLGPAKEEYFTALDGMTQQAQEMRNALLQGSVELFKSSPKINELLKRPEIRDAFVTAAVKQQAAVEQASPQQKPKPGKFHI